MLCFEIATYCVLLIQHLNDELPPVANQNAVEFYPCFLFFLFSEAYTPNSFSSRNLVAKIYLQVVFLALF